LWDLAAADFAKAYQFHVPSPASSHLWFCHALLRVLVGDTEGYRTVAARVPELVRQSPVKQVGGRNELARALTLAPAPGIDLGWAAEQAESAIKHEQGPWSQNALGLVHYRAGKYEMALAPLQEAIRLSSEWRFAIVSHSVLAMANHRLHRADEARKALMEAARGVGQWQQSLLAFPVDPIAGKWWDVLEGLVLYREAKIMIDGSAPPDDPRPMIVRARAFAALGDRDKAEEACSYAAALGADSLDIRLASAVIRTCLGNWTKALHDYEKCLELAPKSAVTHNDLAWLLATCPESKLRDPRRAVELAKKAVELTSNAGMHWNTLGVSQYRTGNWNEAFAALDNSMKLRNGGDSFDWYFLAMTHHQMGHKKEARQWYDRAVEWHEKNQPKDEDLARFRSEAEKLLEVKN
jgi:tetratricopeptide (TPR) repeat protein